MDPPKLPFRPYITKSERKNCVNPKLLPLDNQLKSNQINETYIQQLFLSQEIILQQNVKKYYSKPFRRIKISEHISSSPVWTTQWCPKYSHLLAATCDNYIHLYDIFTTQKRVYSIQENKMTKYCCWSNTSRQLMSACVDGSISVYDFLHCGVLSTRLKLSTIPSCCLWWKDNNDVVLIGGNNSFLEAYDLRSNERVAKYEVKGAGDVLSMDLFPDACNIVVSYNEVNRQSSSHNLIIWDIRHAAKISDQIFHERYSCPCVRVHPSGKSFIAQTTGNYAARFIANNSFKLDKFIRYENHKVDGFSVKLDITPDGRYLVSGSSDGSLVFYKFTSGQVVKTLKLSKNSSCLDVKVHPILPGVVISSNWDGDITIFE